VKTFNAVATREGKWWVVEVEGVGTTQGRTTEEAEFMAADVVVAMLQLDPGEFEVNVVFRLPGDADKQVAEARQANQAATIAQKSAAAAIRTALSMVLAEGISKKDAAHVLGVSPQRVSQLTGTRSRLKAARRSQIKH
jgi:hypothetical protein